MRFTFRLIISWIILFLIVFFIYVLINNTERPETDIDKPIQIEQGYVQDNSSIYN